MIGPVLFNQPAHRAQKFSVAEKNYGEKIRTKKQQKNKPVDYLNGINPERQIRYAVSELMLELNKRTQHLAVDLNRKWLNGSFSFEEYRQQVQLLYEDFITSLNHTENSAA